MSLDRQQQTPRQRAPMREIVGWAMFDFANQAYTLLIITVVFNELFTTVIVGDRNDAYRLGNLLWSVALAVSFLLVVLVSPVCGAIMDQTASKKRFLFASYALTVVTSALLYLVEPGMILLGLVLVILSNFAYSIGESFIASFLPDLGPPSDLGWISGFGWALGYVGGLLAAGFTLVILGETSSDNFDRIRWVGPFAGGFFMLAAIPTFLWLRERGVALPRRHGQSYFRMGFERVRDTWSELRQFRDLAVFLCSVFFTMAGIYIIIAFAFIYGAQVIGWDTTVRNSMFVVVQVTAALGAVGFGFLQQRLGARTTYLLTLGLWVVAIVAIWATPVITMIMSRLSGHEIEAQWIFLVVGVLAGTSLGSSQSASRTLVGLFSPLEKSAEFFGFWGLANKLAGVFGILGLGLLQMLVGLQAAILFCAALFLVAMLICLLVDQRRGEQVALRWRDRSRSSSLSARHDPAR